MTEGNKLQLQRDMAEAHEILDAAEAAVKPWPTARVIAFVILLAGLRIERAIARGKL